MRGATARSREEIATRQVGHGVLESGGRMILEHVERRQKRSSPSSRRAGREGRVEEAGRDPRVPSHVVMRMDARSLNCPDCGAAVPANSTECAFCHARLATIGCPKCYALVFVGSKHCQRCGADVGQPTDRDAKPLDCPRKCGPMRAVRFGGADMYL